MKEKIPNLGTFQHPDGNEIVIVGRGSSVLHEELKGLACYFCTFNGWRKIFNNEASRAESFKGFRGAYAIRREDYDRLNVREDGTPYSIPELPEVEGGKLVYRGLGSCIEDKKKYHYFYCTSFDVWEDGGVSNAGTHPNTHYAEFIPDEPSEDDILLEKARALTPEGAEFLGREDSFSADEIDTENFEYACFEQYQLIEGDWEDKDWDINEQDHLDSNNFYWYRRPIQKEDEPDAETKRKATKRLFSQWAKARGVTLGDNLDGDDLYSVFCSMLNQIKKGL